MFWEALSQPTEWVIAISCKSYCLTKGCSIFYPHPTPRMVGFWKEGFSFSSKTVHTKKKPLGFHFSKGTGTNLSTWIPAILTAGKGGSDKKWMSQVLHLVACVGSVSNWVIARKLEWEQKKKKRKGEGEGRRGNVCPETPRFWKTPLDNFTVLFICKLTARQDTRQYNRLL